MILYRYCPECNFEYEIEVDNKGLVTANGSVAFDANEEEIVFNVTHNYVHGGECECLLILDTEELTEDLSGKPTE